ncbi:MAG TPA: STAS domain-containing protein [Candidatus Aquilonibacter sp.]
MNIEEGAAAIAVSGDVDLSSAYELSQLEKRLFGKETIVFDVGALSHVDSTFLRFLVELQAHRHTPVKLVGVQPRLRRILEITGLSRAFVLA